MYAHQGSAPSTQTFHLLSVYSTPHQAHLGFRLPQSLDFARELALLQLVVRGSAARRVQFRLQLSHTPLKRRGTPRIHTHTHDAVLQAGEHGQAVEG